MSERNYHTTKWFSENLLATEIKKAKEKMNKLVYFCLSTLETNKILMYEFWYDYIKPKYQHNAKLCYINTGDFTIHNKIKDVYKDIANDVEKRYYTSNYETNRPLSKGENKKVIGLMKDELGGKIMTEFVGLRPKTYFYLIDDGNSGKKAKGMEKKCAIKRILNFRDYKDYLLNNKLILNSQQRFKSK